MGLKLWYLVVVEVSGRGCDSVSYNQEGTRTSGYATPARLNT